MFWALVQDPLQPKKKTFKIFQNSVLILFLITSPQVLMEHNPFLSLVNEEQIIELRLLDTYAGK
jgi:hypothetical protein